MYIEKVEDCCPNCKSKNRETFAWGENDFRYKCQNCGCTYEVHYEKVATKVREFKMGKIKPITVEEFLAEYNSEWKEK